MPIDLTDIAAEAAAIKEELAGQERLLPTVGNPEQKTDMLCRLQSHSSAIDRPVVIIYVPDKLLIGSGGFDQFCASFDPQGDCLEAYAGSFLRAINDELVPRWLQLRVGAGDHRVLLEERQPKWSNDQLLSRLDPF